MIHVEYERMQRRMSLIFPSVLYSGTFLVSLGSFLAVANQAKAVTFTDDPTCIEGMSNSQDSTRPVKDCYCVNPGGRDLDIVSSITEFGKCPPPPDPAAIPAAPPPPSLTSGTCYATPGLPTTVTVSGYVSGKNDNEQWQSTGAVLDAYSKVVVTYNSGTVDIGPYISGSTPGPQGDPGVQTGDGYGLPGGPLGALIARVGINPYYAGDTITISGQTAVGPLELGINEYQLSSGVYADNSGSWSVTVSNDPSCGPRPTPAPSQDPPIPGSIPIPPPYGYPCTASTVAPSVVVPADTRDWVHSGQYLTSVSKIVATITSSTWWITPNCGSCDPLTGAGPLASPGYLSTNAPEGQLLAKIGNTIIPVNSPTFTFDGSLYQGEITFAPNDDVNSIFGNGPNDNTGSVTVSFGNDSTCITPTTSPPASPTPPSSGYTCKQMTLPGPVIVDSKDATWKSSGVVIDSTRKVRMKSSGAWWVTPLCGPCTSAGSFPANQSQYVMPSAGEGELLAKVGSYGPIDVGFYSYVDVIPTNYYLFDGTTGTYSGEITFTVNDDTPHAYGLGHSDNSGTVTVTFENDPSCEP